MSFLSRYGSVGDLPECVPVFPLAGALLLPRAELPLNVFEPRYLDLVQHAMAGDRVIGMIQPVPGDASDTPELVSIGCLGRITSYSETEDSRLIISLTGIIRFEVSSELAVTTPFRQIQANYVNFAGDLMAETGARAVDRSALIKAFRDYLDANNMSANWEEVDRVSTEILVNTLSQLAPYAAPEKQALLEAADLKTRADMLIAITELALSGGTKGARLQ
jgi:uncharacterized protein